MCVVLLILTGAIIPLFGQSSEEISSGPADSLRRVIQNTPHDTTRVNAMIEMSWYYWDKSQFDSALVFAERAHVLAERCKFPRGAGDALSNIANVYWFKGNYAQSLEYYVRALRIRQELGYKPAIASNLNNIGNVYLRQGNNTEALNYYAQSLRVHEELGNSSPYTFS